MTKKVYAIKEGFDKSQGEPVSNIIVNTWAECEAYIKGVKGAKYKSFTNSAEAQKYLSEGDAILQKGRDEYPTDIHHAYVDGSYNISTERYSYGLVVMHQDVIEYVENGSALDNSQKDIRQIGGELRASIRALQYCGEHSIKEVAIFHDYQGVCYHATGFWERREESSKQYYELYNKLVNQYAIKVYFVKVDSHTGDFYNEMADEFAKASGGLNLNYETEKLLKGKHLMVKSQDIKEKFKEVLCDPESLNRIIVTEVK